MFVSGVTATLAGVAVPPILATIDDYRAAGAVRYLSTRLQRTRMEAVARTRDVALQFVESNGQFTFAVFVDGNGDGVRTRDIQRGVDTALTTPERLPDNFSGVDFGVLPGLPPVDPGGTPPGIDPIKLGSSNLLTFTAAGTSSTGSVYIKSARNAQYVIRVFGESGKTRILKFNPRTNQWMPI